MISLGEYIACFSTNKSGLIRIVDFDVDREITITTRKKGIPAVNLSTRINKTGNRKKSYKCDSFEEALVKGLRFLEIGDANEKIDLLRIQALLNAGEIEAANKLITSVLAKNSDIGG